ncbi:MAG: hypothetical protein IKU47_08425 [Oscillospiraceae bacterium]|nr:hypothetical protein [Oscillospiraceae bacterium]
MNSGGGEVEASGNKVSGFIPLEINTIYAIRSDNKDYVRYINTYKSDFSFYHNSLNDQNCYNYEISGDSSKKFLRLSVLTEGNFTVRKYL